MRFVSVREAAYCLAVSCMTIRNWCEQDKLKSIQIGDKYHVDLWSFLESQGIDPQPLFDSLEKRKVKNASKNGRTRKTA